MSPSAKRSVFVAGCRGQLGQDVMATLASVHTVTGADLPELDITVPTSVVAVLGAAHPQRVLNCAAYTNVDRCETDREAARRINVDGPRLLAQYAEAHGAWLLHISTDYVFDGTRPPPEPYTESDEPNPKAYYGVTKLEGEVAVREVTERHIIVRTAWLYGANGHNFLKTMLRLALANPEKAIRVVNDQHGCPTWSWRLAMQLKSLITKGKKGVYHATGDGHCTWFELASTFLRLMNVPHRIEPCTTAEYPLPAQRPQNSILANARLKAEGLHVMRHWTDDLTEFVQRHREALLAETQAKLAK